MWTIVNHTCDIRGLGPLGDGLARRGSGRPDRVRRSPRSCGEHVAGMSCVRRGPFPSVDVVPATGHDRGVSGRERASSRRLASAAAICGVAGILTIGVGGAIGAVPGVMSIARAREDRTGSSIPSRPRASRSASPSRGACRSSLPVGHAPPPGRRRRDPPASPDRDPGGPRHPAHGIARSRCVVVKLIERCGRRPERRPHAARLSERRHAVESWTRPAARSGRPPEVRPREGPAESGVVEAACTAPEPPTSGEPSRRPSSPNRGSLPLPRASPGAPQHDEAGGDPRPRRCESERVSPARRPPRSPPARRR